MVLIERAIAGEIELGLPGLDLRVDLGIGLLVMSLLGFTPMWLVAVRFAQGREGVLERDL